MSFYELKKGINLNVINTKKFNTNSIVILFKQKLDRKTSTLNSLIPKVLSKGSKKYNSIREINVKTEKMYGANFYTDIVKKGEYQLIEFFIEFIPSNVSNEDVISFLNEIILNPLVENGSFEKQYFELSKQENIDIIKNKSNDKKEYCKTRLIEEMFKYENFSIDADGYLDDLEENKINETTLFNHYKKLISESEINIITIGNINVKEFERVLKLKFIDNILYRDFKEIKIKDNLKQKTEVNYITEKFDITQGKLCLGLRTNILPENHLFFAMLVGNEILGGGAGSKLFLNVREKESLCYYIGSFVYIFKGCILIEVGIDFNHFEKVINYIQKEVENIKNNKFTKEDLENAIISLEKKYKSILDYNTSIMDFYLTNFLNDKKLTVEEFIDNLKKVKKEDILEAFKDIWMDTCYFMKGV